jgi:hypothetical protein
MRTDHRGAGCCYRHGGNTESHKQAAQKEIARQAIGKLALVDGDELGEVDPRDVLAEELWRTRCAVHVLGHMVNELKLEPGGLYVQTRHASGETTGDAKPHVLWVMWVEERKHLNTVAAYAARAGVEARRLGLAEQTAQTVATLLRAIFGDPDLKLDAARQQTAMLVAAKHLRLVASTG